MIADKLGSLDNIIQGFTLNTMLSDLYVWKRIFTVALHVHASQVNNIRF